MPDQSLQDGQFRLDGQIGLWTDDALKPVQAYLSRKFEDHFGIVLSEDKRISRLEREFCNDLYPDKI